MIKGGFGLGAGHDMFLVVIGILYWKESFGLTAKSICLSLYNMTAQNTTCRCVYSTLQNIGIVFVGLERFSPSTNLIKNTKF